MNNKILILINPDARGETALDLWDTIEMEILDQLNPSPLIYNAKALIHGEDNSELEKIIRKQKIGSIIVAGGDGTVNRIVNFLMRTGRNKTLKLGAIGLGSSNDFHKPVLTKLKQFPLRIQQDKTQVSDLGKVTFVDEHGDSRTQYFIINASIGVTAEANRFFNSENKALTFLKRTHTETAILYAALRTLMNYHQIPTTLRYNGHKQDIHLNNLAVLKSPYVSGGMRYDQKIRPNDGALGLDYCMDMNRIDLLKVMRDLSNGRFSGQPNREAKFIKSVSVDTDRIVTLETDGEVFRGNSFRFSVVPECITLLGK